MRRMGGLSGTALQWLATVTMTVDHIGVVLMRGSSQYYAFRMIGRTAFPIYAFLLVQGMIHTKSLKNFALRLAVFALISELPFDLAFYNRPFYFGHQNIFFTLLIGVLGICGLMRSQNAPAKFGVILAVALLAQLLNTDYGAIGVVLITLFWQLRDARAGTAITMLVFVTGMTLDAGPIYLFAALSLVPMLCYNGLRGGASSGAGAFIRRWGFYLYYPAHLLVLGFIAR